MLHDCPAPYANGERSGPHHALMRTDLADDGGQLLWMAAGHICNLLGCGLARRIAGSVCAMKDRRAS